MQDQDAPPVEEGETGGGVAVVPEAGIPLAAAAITSTMAFTTRLWTTVTAPLWRAVVTGRALDASGRVLPLIFRNPNPSRCRIGKMPPPVFSPLWTISSFRPKSRKLPAS